MLPNLRGLYYITHIDNIPSILRRGILSHRKVIDEGINYTPIYDKEIIENRKAISTPDGRSLWEFANLYFQPRNAMLYRVIFFSNAGVENIAIIGLRDSILRKKEIYITTGNAASPYSSFIPAKDVNKYLKNLRERVDKGWWSYEDGSKRELMAECLVPESVPPEYISEIYVAKQEVCDKLHSMVPSRSIPVIPEPELFFLPSRKITFPGTNLSLVEGDMFFSRMQTLTVSVNTMGVMGKGLASRAKYQFPDVYVKYQDLCRQKVLKMGKPYLYKRETSLDSVLADEAENLPTSNLQTWFLLFPTKTDWRKPADLQGIKRGLEWLVENYSQEGIKSLAIPALGCGLGWLEWGVVGPILCTELAKLNIPVMLYLPAEKRIPDDQLTKHFLLSNR